MLMLIKTVSKVPNKNILISIINSNNNQHSFAVDSKKNLLLCILMMLIKAAIELLLIYQPQQRLLFFFFHLSIYLNINYFLRIIHEQSIINRMKHEGLFNIKNNKDRPSSFRKFARK